MSSISTRLDFYQCSIDNIAIALQQRNFAAVLSDYDTSFSYYDAVADYELANSTIIPIMQIVREVDVLHLHQRHLLNVHNDPNTKLRIKALKAGAADVLTHPYNVKELHARLLRLVTRANEYEAKVRDTENAKEALQIIAYDEIEKGFKINQTWSVADGSLVMTSANGGLIKLTQRERLIFKALAEAEANGEFISKSDLDTYLRKRQAYVSRTSIATIIWGINKKLEYANADFRIQRIMGRYIFTEL